MCEQEETIGYKGEDHAKGADSPAHQAMGYVKKRKAGIFPEGEKGCEQEDGLEATGGYADLSLFLVVEGEGRQLHCVGIGFVCEAVAFLGDLQGADEIIEDDIVREWFI